MCRPIGTPGGTAPEATANGNSPHTWVVVACQTVPPSTLAARPPPATGQPQARGTGRRRYTAPGSAGSTGDAAAGRWIARPGPLLRTAVHPRRRAAAGPPSGGGAAETRRTRGAEAGGAAASGAGHRRPRRASSTGLIPKPSAAANPAAWAPRRRRSRSLDCPARCSTSAAAAPSRASSAVSAAMVVVT